MLTKYYKGNLKERNRKSKPKWEDNIKMGLRKRRYKLVDRIQLARYTVKWRAVFNTIMKHIFQ
jgi:hypothetical protein